MAIATVRLCDLIASGYDFEGKALSKYPAPSDSVRKEINEAFLQYYWLREIGFQSPDEMSQQVDFAMRRIMPYYNARRTINALDIGADPLQSYTETAETITKNVDERTGSSNGSTTNKNTMNDVRTGGSTDSRNESGYDKHYEMPVSGGSNNGSSEDTGGMDDNYAESGNSRKSKDESSNQHNETTDTVNNGESSHTDSHTDSTTTNGTSTVTRSGSSVAKFELLEKYRSVIENLNQMIVTDPAIKQLWYGNFS